MSHARSAKKRQDGEAIGRKVARNALERLANCAGRARTRSAGVRSCWHDRTGKGKLFLRNEKIALALLQLAMGEWSARCINVRSVNRQGRAMVNSLYPTVEQVRQANLARTAYG